MARHPKVPGPPHCRGFELTLRDITRGRTPLGLSQRPLPDNTQHSQKTDICSPSVIRTRNPSKRMAAVAQLRLRGHWDRFCRHVGRLNGFHEWSLDQSVRIRGRFSLLGHNTTSTSHSIAESSNIHQE